MCGIAGILSTQRGAVSEEKLVRMTNAVAHRGPDGDDFWINEKGITGFGHRRLSIIDLSTAAAQPMHYLGRYTIVHNGEIYNYVELKHQLRQKGYSFQSLSDTEVILAAYDCWKEDCLQYFDGMFAFAIWDELKQRLFCARDRFGEKPFYYFLHDQAFYFGSEMKALWAIGIPKAVNEKLLLNYLALGYSSYATDKSITFYKNIFSLPAGHYLIVDGAGAKPVLHSYYDIDKDGSVSITDDEATEKFLQLFKASVEKRLRSDVPLGTSLSGGLDSSSIVAAIQKMLPASANNTQKTFTSGFPGYENDETAYAGKVANQFHLQQYITTPTSQEFIDDLATLLYHHEEPVSSASVYAQYRVFQTARSNNVKVLLDGQGADEILAGYHKYIHWYLQELWTSPAKMRSEMRAFRDHHIPFDWGWKNVAAAVFPAQAASQLEKRELRRIEMHPDFADEFREQYFDRGSIHKPLVRRLNDILYFNTRQSGLEELLRNADRNSMAHGREVRLPFLDHKLVEFLFSLPAHFKIRSGWTKWLLRKCVEHALPEEIVWRQKKVAFEPPQKEWMNHTMVIDAIVQSKQRLVKAGVLKREALAKKIQPHSAYAADQSDWRYLVAGMLLP